MTRLYCPVPVPLGQAFDLPATAARHAQVLRLQPGDALDLFDGVGGAWTGRVFSMGRQTVQVRAEVPRPPSPRPARTIHLVSAMPANERMDWLVEKATELGAASLQPLVSERTVLRLSGERADKKQAHWQAIAVAACEQSGRNRVPAVGRPQDLSAWIGGLPGDALRLVLSLQPQARPLAEAAAGHPARPVLLLSGPEGGLSPAELDLAQAHGFISVTLGPRVLRAETAPLAALAVLGLGA